MAARKWKTTIFRKIISNISGFSNEDAFVTKLQFFQNDGVAFELEDVARKIEIERYTDVTRRNYIHPRGTIAILNFSSITRFFFTITKHGMERDPKNTLRLFIVSAFTNLHFVAHFHL